MRTIYWEPHRHFFNDISENRSQLKWKILPIHRKFLLHFVWFLFLWLIHNISNLFLYMNVYTRVWNRWYNCISSPNKFMLMFEYLYADMADINSLLYLVSWFFFNQEGNFDLFFNWVFLTVKIEILSQYTTVNCLNI